MSMHELGEYINRRMGALGLNQTSLAARTPSLSQTAISDLVNGKRTTLPPRDAMFELADVLQVSEYDLLREAGYLRPRDSEDAELSIYTWIEDLNRVGDITPRLRAKLYDLVMLELKHRDE